MKVEELLEEIRKKIVLLATVISALYPIFIISIRNLCNCFVRFSFVMTD